MGDPIGPPFIHGECRARSQNGGCRAGNPTGFGSKSVPISGAKRLVAGVRVASIAGMKIAAQILPSKRRGDVSCIKGNAGAFPTFTPGSRS
jgi:hypothetical protein